MQSRYDEVCVKTCLSHASHNTYLALQVCANSCCKGSLVRKRRLAPFKSDKFLLFAGTSADASDSLEAAVKPAVQRIKRSKVGT